MYYAKIDKFTGEVFPCMDNSHHNGTLGKTDKASEIRYFAENEHDVNLFCHGWNSMLGATVRFNKSKKIVLNVGTISTRERCDEIVTGWIGNNIREMLQLNISDESELPIDAWYEGTWFLYIGGYSYLINVTEGGHIAGIMPCDNMEEYKVPEVVTKGNMLAGATYEK